MASCPACRAALESGRCDACGGRWIPAARLAEAAGPLGPFRRLVAKGPLTAFACADCAHALKALDVPGFVHEGDLFWGLESARPSGTFVADGCPRCGGAFVDAANLARAGGPDALVEGLARVARAAS